MSQYILFIAFLGIGFAIAYFLFRSKSANGQKKLLSFLDQVVAKRNVASVNSEGLEDVAERLEKLVKEDGVNQHEVKPAEDQASEQAQTKKQLENILIINELGQRLTSSLKLNETFDHLFHTLNSMMDASVLELGVYDREMERWEIYSNLKEGLNEGYENHVAQWVKDNNRTVFLNDVELDYGRYVNEPLEVQDGRKAASLMSFPVIFEGEVSGVLSVISFRKDAFDDYHRNSIEHLLEFLSVALQNAHTHEQLNLLKIRAEQSEKYEQQFLANMSHEIRTPMNAVLGMTNLLLDTQLNEKQIKYLKAINTSSKNLLVIINDILDLSKLEAGKMEIEKIPFRIRDVIENVSDTNKFKAEEKGLAFEINISPDIPAIVKGDPTRLNQVITNLCSNAIKFTEKGKITISVDQARDSHFISFRVIDTGIGIPEDKLHLLFSNFKQVDSSTFRKYGGTGLGLSISKTLIELQGGKVDVKSEFGKGSEFSVHIPYDVAAEEDFTSLDSTNKSNYDSLSGIKILIAEDNEYNQIVVNDTLESLVKGVEIHIAENGKIALDMASEDRYDVILMDAQMPEMDGLDATRAIRKLDDKVKAAIPIIALTASVHKADIDKCMDAGMDDFVPKPFTRDELLGTLAKYYENKNGPIEEDEPEKISEPKIEKQVKETPDENGVTDLTFLKDFADGDKNRMKKYVGMYLKLLPANIEGIEQADKAADKEALVKVLHSMRPHLNYMGMKQAAELAGEIENTVRSSGDVSEIPGSTAIILDHCKQSDQELNEWLSSNF